MDDEFTTGVRDLHQKVTRLDDLLRQHRGTDDLRERLAAAACAAAEEARGRLRRIMAVVATVMLLWTPLTAYAAVWVHEKVRNNCYPGVALIQPPGPPVPSDVPGEPWFCGIFPATDRPNH